MDNAVMARLRLYNQRILGSTLETPEDVVRKLGAMQAQDYRQAVWAVGLRTQVASLKDVERAIMERQIVHTWTLRGTIHFVPPETVRGIVRMTAPRILGSAKRRQAQLGLDEEVLARCRRTIYDTLKEGQPVTRSVLLQRLEEVGIPTDSQRGYHILWNSAYQQLICFGPMSGKQQTFVLLDAWVPNAQEQTSEEVLAELALTYFSSHGPATITDFAWWAGMTLTDARNGLEAVKGQGLVSENINGTTYWMAEDVVNAVATDIHLLPGFDEYMLGYKDRSAVLAPEYAPRIVPGNNGIFQPTLVIDGQILGTWKRTIKAKGIELTIFLFEPLGINKEQLLQVGERYAAFIGLPILKFELVEASDL